jgi:CubicO group peptidase (beta-lactamase class C family)
LSARSGREITTDDLTPAQKSAAVFLPNFFDTRGWGYGVGVSTAPDAVSPIPGRYGWDGGFGTSWVNDPNRDLIGIMMTHSTDFLFSGGVEAFWRSLYTSTG